MTDTKTTAEPALIISRTFKAPRALVYKAWTEAERLAQWWGPKGYTMSALSLDLRPGGRFHYRQASPEGQEMWGLFLYQEVVAPEKIVFITGFSNPQGELVRAPFAETWPMEILNVLTFEEENGQTTVTMKGGPHNATPAEHEMFANARPMVQQGFGGTLDQLEAYLASAQA